MSLAWQIVYTWKLEGEDTPADWKPWFAQTYPLQEDALCTIDVIVTEHAKRQRLSPRFGVRPDSISLSWICDKCDHVEAASGNSIYQANDDSEPCVHCKVGTARVIEDFDVREYVV